MLCLGLTTCSMFLSASGFSRQRFDGWYNNLANPKWGSAGGWIHMEVIHVICTRLGLYRMPFTGSQLLTCCWPYEYNISWWGHSKKSGFSSPITEKYDEGGFFFFFFFFYPWAKMYRKIFMNKFHILVVKTLSIFKSGEM